MKTLRTLSLMLLACVTILCSCSKDDGEGAPPPPEPTFTISVDEVTESTAKVTITPISEDTVYFYDAISATNLAEYHENSIPKYIENLLNEQMLWEEKDVATIVAEITTKGKSTYSFENLTPGQKYICFAVGLNAKGELNTEVVQQEFETPAVVSENTFSVEFKNQVFNGVDIYITPSNADFYYYTVRSGNWCKQFETDEEMLKAIFNEDSFLMSFYATSGNTEYLNEQVWNTDTGYELLVFGYDRDYSVATTKLFRFPFRTAQAEGDPAACTFEVEAKGITTRGVTISIKPSNTQVMYMWDLITAASYEANKDKMGEYVTAYINEIGLQMLESNLTRDASGNIFSNLEPGTQYYVWAACVDENGQLTSEVKMSQPFNTNEEALSDVSVEVIVDKYFDGSEMYDAYHETDPDAFPEAVKGNAYVPVVFSPSTEPAAYRWWGQVYNEDLSNPENPTDEEIINTLTNGGGLTLPTYKPFILAWDTPVTILAVAMDEEGNFSKVVRKVCTFSEDGASPADEYVAPETGASADSYNFMPRAKKQIVKMYRTMEAARRTDMRK